MIKCPNCGAELKYEAKDNLVECEHCRSKFDPKKLDTKVHKSQEIDGIFEGKSYLCGECGATLLTFDETAITFCSYCGSQAMIESRMIKQNNPDYIIPFKISKEECINIYKKRISKSLFAPKYMKDDIVVSKFRGIYIPYCVYKFEHTGSCVNEGEKYDGRRGDYVYYKKYKIRADLEATYDGISYDLISNFYDKYSLAMPYDFNGVEPFNPNYLTGFYADLADVDKMAYERIAHNIAHSDCTDRLRKEKEYKKCGCEYPKARLSTVDKKTGMFPVYFLALKSKDQKHVCYAIVNGQTGKIAVDIPIDFKKYVITTLILSVIVFLCINSLSLILPTSLCKISIVSSFISILVILLQLSAIESNEKHTNDIGYRFSKVKAVVSPKSFKIALKPFIGILLGTIMLIINPISDAYYYGTSTIMLLLVVLSFKEIITKHNELTSNRLPQLNKRGGDESEE